MAVNKCQTQFWLIDKSPQHDALQAPVKGNDCFLLVQVLNLYSF